MNNLNQYIQEKLKINKDSKLKAKKYKPKNKAELVSIIQDKLQDTDLDDVLDLNDIDISNINNLSYLFENISHKKIDMNGWDVSHVIDIHGLFWNNEIVEEIHIENWDVKNVETVYGAFYFCKKIKQLNLDNWNFNKCTEFDLMFKGCENLDTHFTDKWENKIPNTITMKHMFEGCKYIPKWYHE